MATRLKTVEYWFPHLATIPDNTTTNFTQITVYLPETIVAFKNVYVECVLHDAWTTSTSITSRALGVRLGAAGYSTITNAQTLANSGENRCFQILQDFTTYFTNNWSGSSMTMDLQVLANASAAGCRNGSAKVVITYEYNDTSTTHVKTVRIPLDAPNAALGSSKPGTANATIPLLDTYCPEVSKTFRQTSIVVQGNTEATGTTDISLSFQVDAAGSSLTSQLYERGSNVDMWYRLNQIVSFTTSATHDFFIWASTTDFDHPHVWLVVTYEFDPDSTTILNSLMLPVEFSGGAGITTNLLYQRAEREIWIQEPETITVQTCAAYILYDQKAAISGIEARLNGGSWVTYTSVAANVGGLCGFMIRNDSISLTRGRNSVSVDIFCTDTVDTMGNISAFFLINYHSGIAADGVGAHNHTVFWNLISLENNAARCHLQSASTLISIPEDNYFITSVGCEGNMELSGTLVPQGVHVGVERKSSEGGHLWENVYEAFGSGDPEDGIRLFYSTARSIFNRWKVGVITDADESRLDLETARVWRIQSGGGIAFFSLNLIMTYHTIEFTVSGTIGFSNGGTVNLTLARVSPGEPVLKKTRTGDGAYSFTWFDNTEDVQVLAYEDDNHTGLSGQGVAS